MGTSTMREVRRSTIAQRASAGLSGGVSAGAVAALMLAGCGSGATSTTTTVSTTGGAATPTPATDAVTPVVRAYFDDLRSKCSTAYGMFDSAAQQYLGNVVDYCNKTVDDNTNVDFRSPSYDDATHASIEVLVHKTDGSTHDDTLDLVKSEGAWLIDNLRPTPTPKGTAMVDFGAVQTEVPSQYQHNLGISITLACPLSGKQALAIGQPVLCSFSSVGGTPYVSCTSDGNNVCTTYTPTGTAGQIRITPTLFNNWVWHTV